MPGIAVRWGGEVELTKSQCPIQEHKCEETCVADKDRVVECTNSTWNQSEPGTHGLWTCHHDGTWVGVDRWTGIDWLVAGSGVPLCHAEHSAMCHTIGG